MTGMRANPVRVETVDPLRDPRWNQYVLGHPSALVYHLAEWSRILSASYGVRPRYLIAKDHAGNLRGVFPLVLRRGLVRERRLISLFSVPTAGPLGDDREHELILLDAACQMADGTGCGLELRARGNYLQDRPALQPVETNPTWVLSMPASAADLLARWPHGSNVARSIRRAERSGLHTHEASGRRALDRFYRLYVETMRGHASLPVSLRSFRLAQEMLGSAGIFRLFLVQHAGVAVAGGVFHAFGETVELVYNASHRQARELRPNHALYWYVANWAIERGYRFLDFGPAGAQTSLGRFKAQWGSDPLPEYHFVYPASADRSDRDRAGGGALKGLPGALVDHIPLRLWAAAGELAWRYA